MSNVKLLILLAFIWNIFIYSVFIYIVFWKGMSGWWFLVPMTATMTVKDVD